MNIELKFRKTVVQDGLIKPGSGVVLAVSGGIDSMVMLSLFAKFKPAADLSLTVAHINHGLRGEESDREEKLTQEKAASYGLPFLSTRWNFDGKGNLQDEARRYRMDFLRKLARDESASYIATAHHQDDQAETVFMHLLRGSGLKGLSGISWCSSIDDKITLVRPMLNISRREIEKYAKENDVQFETDSSNLSSKYRRNELRHTLLPKLEKLNPNILNSISSMADRLREDEAALTGIAEEFCSREFKQQDDSIVFSRGKFMCLAPAVMRRVLREAFRRITGSTAGLNADQISRMEAITVEEGDIGTYMLPNACTFERLYNRLIISRSKT